jgi:glucose-1-phosphate thymidylyltransferase
MAAKRIRDAPVKSRGIHDAESMKGVILAGGTGSRLHPLTRITNKHLLPIYDRPMISYAIEALVKGGVSEMMLVTGGTHAGEFLRLLGNGQEFGIDRLFYAYQEKPGGIAEALALAERFVGRDRSVVLLADNVFGRSIRPCFDAFRKQAKGARVVLSRVGDPEHLRHLGVAKLNGDRRIEQIIEKPDQPPGDLAVTGVYFYDETVWGMLPRLKPSSRGELEITDVNNWYVDQGLMEYDVLEGFWGDAGESMQAYYAVQDFVRANGINRES